MSDADVTIIAKEQIVVVDATENVVEVAVQGPQGIQGPKGDRGDPGPGGASSWSDITDTPTTLAGYGIEDGATAAQGAKADAALQPGASSDQINEGGSHLFFTSSRVLSAVLSGLSTATSATISAADSVLTAFGKLQAQVTALASSKLDVAANAASATKLAVARTINGVAFDGTSNITVADATKEPAISAGSSTQYWRGDKTWQTLNKSAVGLGNVDNTADASKPVSTAQLAALNLKVDLASVGVANGVASLDSGGKVPALQLPSFVDDVLEFANLAAFPATGSTGVIYVADDTGKIYRWSGSSYIEISPSPGSTDSVPEGSTNLYFTSARVIASVLSGLSTATNAAITASDTILSAFGKLQAQITGLASSKLDTTATAAAATKLATARTINGVSFDGTANITVADSTKEPTISAGTTSQFWRGDKTWQDFATTVRAAALTGLSTATNSAITATDSVLVALGKLQAQLTALSSTVSGKQDAITGGASTITSSNLTTSRALVSDGSGKVAVSATTSTELGYVSGVTSALQTQLNGKAPTASPTFTGTIDYGTLP